MQTIGLGVPSSGWARSCLKLQILSSSSSRDSVGTGTLSGSDRRGGIWWRHGTIAGLGCSLSRDDFVDFVTPSFLVEIMSRRRMMLIVTNANKSRRWKAEPLVKGSVTRRALHIVKTLRSVNNPQEDEVDSSLRKWVVSMQPKRRDWLDVLKEFDNKLERRIYFKISEWGLEESWFEAGVRDYTKLIDRYGKQGYVAKAEGTFRAMEERELTPDVATYTVLLAAYGRSKMVEKVKEVMQDMALAGLELDAVAYKTMIIAYGSAGLLQDAEEVLISMELAEVEGGLDAYLALLTAYGRLGRASDAQRIFDRMHLKGFRGNLKAFTALMEAYSNAQDYANAELIFGSLRSAGFHPDDRVVASLVSVYANTNMLDKAVEIIVDLENAGMKLGPITLTSLIGWFGKAGLIEEADQCFRELRLNPPITCKAYVNMFAAYVRAGQLERADNIWVTIKEDGVVLDGNDCRAMVEALLSQHHYEEGQKLFAELQHQGWELTTDLKAAVAECAEVVA